MKNFTRILCALNTVALLAAAQPSFADDSTTVTVPAGTQGAALSCGLDDYGAKVANIKTFTVGEDIASFAPGISGAGLIYILASSGSGAGILVLGAVGAIGVSFATFYTIKAVKSAESRSYQEVINDLTEAKGIETNNDPEGDAALRNVTNKIDNPGIFHRHKNDYSEAQIAQAILDAANDGGLCGNDGKLVTKENFRAAIIKQLAATQAAEAKTIEQKVAM
jgi:hypothetical protein